MILVSASYLWIKFLDFFNQFETWIPTYWKKIHKVLLWEICIFNMEIQRSRSCKLKQQNILNNETTLNKLLQHESYPNTQVFLLKQFYQGTVYWSSRVIFNLQSVKKAGSRNIKRSSRSLAQYILYWLIICST